MSYTCCCCFDSELSEQQIGCCNNNHTVCCVCVTRGVQNAIGEMRTFTCPDSSGCTQVLSQPTIEMCITDVNLKLAYWRILTSNELRNVVGLTQCAFCEYAVILDENDTIFVCLTCDKLYCITCKQLSHLGNCLTDVDHETERQIAAISILCCSYPPIIKIDACNHVTCLCGDMWCWYCKGTLSARRENVHTCSGLCPQYEDPRGSIIDVITQVVITEQQELDAAQNHIILLYERAQERERVIQERVIQERIIQERIIQERVAEQERVVQERIDNSARLNQRLYNSILNKKKKEHRKTIKLTRIAENTRSVEINIKIEQLLAERAIILTRLTNM